MGEAFLIVLGAAIGGMWLLELPTVGTTENPTWAWLLRLLIFIGGPTIKVAGWVWDSPFNIDAAIEGKLQSAALAVAMVVGRAALGGITVWNSSIVLDRGNVVGGTLLLVVGLWLLIGAFRYAVLLKRLGGNN